MDRGDTLYRFIKQLQKKKLLTSFINDIFGYKNLNDYNYIFRISKQKGKFIIDVYDNISINRFNRFIFLFNDNKGYQNHIENNVLLTYINISKAASNGNKIDKLAYMLTLDHNKMLKYAKTFLSEEYITILERIIKKANL